MGGARDRHREPIDEDDRAAIDALVARLDAVEDLETFGRTVAEELLALIPGISASYNELNPAAGRAFAVIVPEPDANWWSHFTPIFESFAPQHPFIRHLVAGGDGAACTWDDFADDIRATELHREFYAPLGIESQLLAQLPAPDGVVVGLAVNRGPEGFTDRERAILDVLRSHLIRSYRLVQRTVERDVLGRMLHDQGWHVVLVDDEGAVVSCSSDDVRWRVGELLPSPLLEQFRETAGSPFWTSPPADAPIRIAGSTPDSDLLVHASIIRNRVPPHVVHVRHGAPVPHDRLRALGLSERQAAVAALVGNGATNIEVAAELGISPATVKKHLEHIYRVLGVSTRAAAVAIVSSVR